MREILEKLINEEISIEECERILKADTILEFDEVAKFDKSRSSRTGFPEAVFSPSKDYGDLLLIINNYFTSENPENLIVTKLSSERYEKLVDDLDLEGFELDYNKRAQILVIRNREVPKTLGKVGIITAGTSDINIAEEARVIVEEGGCEAITSYDIGVAGIHRLFPQIAHMIKEGVEVLIVCAGMEGALASVVGGLVDKPVIAVPTSIGYGANFDGLSALLAMLNSCASGVSVVNIDNGYGAGYISTQINRLAVKAYKPE